MPCFDPFCSPLQVYGCVIEIMQEIMVVIRARFDRLKEEVNSDLGAYAGDLVGILEKSLGSNPEWKESLEDLLVIARQCAKMSPDEFWVKCEGIVQSLDDRRQELPIGILKQAHTRLLFILTRCTRLVQFQKESGYDEDRILGLHQLSDLGVYPEQIVEAVRQDMCGSLNKDVNEKHTKKSCRQEQSSGTDGAEVDTAKSVGSSGSYRMSSWKKLPSAAEKNRKGIDSPVTPSKEKSDPLHAKDETKAGSDSLETPVCHPEQTESGARLQSVPLGVWGDQQNSTYENLMICRICEVEIPTVHVEEHSRICTIADRCDLKGLTVNERLERVAETLEKIVDSWSPKSTPKSSDTPLGNFEGTRVSTSSTHEELDEFSPKKYSLSRRCSEDLLDCIPEADNAFLIDSLNALPDMTCEMRSTLIPDPDTKTSSAGSLTPRSPLLTPRTSQIELLLSGWRTISELENYQQVYTEFGVE